MTSLAEPLSALMNAVAILAFVTGGLALMLQARALAGRLLFAGLGLGVLAALAPGLLVGLQPLSIFDLTAGLGLAGGLLAFVLGRPAAGVGLVLPAVWRWVLWPLIGTAVPLWLVALIIAPFSAFIAVWMLQRALTAVYGREAAGHVTGTYLLRLFDGIGRALSRFGKPRPRRE